MARKWKPRKTQAREFSERMRDPQEREAYEDRKRAAAEKRRSKSQFDYTTAGGSFIPTKQQHDFCIENMHLVKTDRQVDAFNQVMTGYATRSKVHHDHIHIVNELKRSNQSF